MEALDAALNQGNGQIIVFASADANAPEQQWHYNNRLHCAHCDIDYNRPLPSTFSFNSPLGACNDCRGFGRVMGIDYGLVIPDENKSLLEGAIRPWQTASYKENQTDLQKYAPAAGVRLSVPWKDLSDAEKTWVINGAEDWKGGRNAWNTQWYGISRFFDWLESRSYRMHVRVMLSKYRSYTPCPTCQSSRLKPDALLWRVGSQTHADENSDGNYQRFMPVHAAWTPAQLNALPGLHVHDLMRMSIDEVHHFFETLALSQQFDTASSFASSGSVVSTSFFI